jgi:flagellar protein FliT
MNALPATEILGSYEHLAQVMARMREAAANDDWERVIALESECAPFYARVMSSEDGPIDEQYQRRKAELICKLLEYDAEIRERVSGQLTHIWRLIHGRTKVEQLSTVYGRARE